MRWPEPISSALALPSGARFYRCALQVNTFAYLKRHSKKINFSSEDSYNQAMIQACKDHGIEVIAVTDHYSVSTAESLWKVARAAGLHVFPGFEAVTKEGVHFLCLFDPHKEVIALERVLGDCGIHQEDKGSPPGKYDVIEFLAECRKWEAVCVAAHVTSDGGLLRTLSGQSRINAWQSPDLLACSLPGPVEDAPANLRPILENKDPNHRRDRRIAIINAQDVSSPQDLEKQGASCWIKMSDLSVEGLRQAFLDPGSRIRLASDPPLEEHAEFVAVGWQGGFLDGAAVNFNENLNVLIGGRGAGKSTVVESLRYVLGLEALADDARKSHEGIIRHVLKSGTKISLLVRSHRPAKREYLIERTIPNPAVVRDQMGKVLSLTPADVMPRTEVYGQHELSELTKSPEKLTRLLERFVERDENVLRRKSEIIRELGRSRSRLLEARNEIKQIEERLGLLPALEETLKTFQEAGLEERLKEQSLLVREERVLKTVPDRIMPYRELLDQLRRALPIDRAFLSAKALEGLPGREILREADIVLETLGRELKEIADQLTRVLDKADQELARVRGHWEERKRSVQTAYENILRELQKSKVDGEEFIRLRRQIEELRPLKERQVILERTGREHQDHRRNLLVEWEDLKSEEFRQLGRAANKVSRQLAGRVRVSVVPAGNREPLFKLLRDQVGGRLSEAFEALEKHPDLSLKEFADACLTGRDAVRQKFGVPPTQADRLAQAPPEVIMQIEEIDLSPTPKVELNTAQERQPPIWQMLESLSTGQKATAVLLLLLLESDAPLVVDQPEDDLDNRFITDGVVPKMREEKQRRQFVFATHNANIPVLGDAELIIGLSPVGEAKAEIYREHLGSIDARPVRELVEEVLEGGKEAFEIRRLKYGF
ncbi:MAG: TrlF family AAA-like ATPase [Candidatus Binatia bacterium]